MASKLNENSQGIAYGLSAYMMWGCFPLFFALFDGVPAYEILVHRIVWSCVFLALVITLMRRWAPVVEALAHPARLGRVLACAVLIALNWGVYIYSVETCHVLQASLGYFLTPLVNVALGMLILRERMARLQGGGHYGAARAARDHALDCCDSSAEFWYLRLAAQTDIA